MKTEQKQSEKALNIYFEASETVTAQHVLYNEFIALYPNMCSKFQMYTLFLQGWGNPTGKDTDGNLGYHKKLKPKVPLQGNSFSKSTPKSTSVAKISYDADSKEFRITFKSKGTTYLYKDVSHEDAFKAFNSDSYGKLARLELSTYKGEKE